ncbi:MAG: PAS domain-containing protein [Cyclobacteriaceae bacterium]|nr:PAS domain-containing protein [Cyclobacteriaceae bacterium]
MQDVTEQRQFEEELKRNNQLLEASQAIAKLGGWELDLINNHLFWTAETYRKHDTSSEEFDPTVDAGVGYFLPESKKQISEALELAMTKGIGYDLFLETYTTKGRKIEVRTTCEVTLVDEKPTKLTGIFQDITEQKKIRNELQASNTRLSIAAEAAKIGIWEFFMDDQKLIWDDKMFDLFNVSKSTFSGTYAAWRSTVHPDALEKSERELQNAIASGQSFNSEFRIVWQDKSIHHIKGMAESVRDQNGTPYKMIGVNYDITERKELISELIGAKERAEESEKKLLEAQELSHVGSWEYITETDTVNWSNELFNIFERSPNLGAPRYSEQRPFYTDESFTRLDKAVLDCVEREIPYEILLNIIAGSGSTKQIISKGQIKKDLEGKIIGCVGTAQDVTKQKKLEAELIAAKEEAEESDRLKTAFLANMSHEIRTPMNGIMGFANLLQKPGTTHQKETEYLALIQQSGTRMLNIINDIISISKIEAGEIQVVLSPTNINEQLEFIRAFFEPEASAKGIQLIITSALSTRKAITITDREKVYGTLANLVKNALKFTHAGTVEVGCREKPEQAELEFYVKDQGIGIQQDQLDFIFERFRQVNESTTRNYEGAGLGLAISKAQVEKLGGRIWVESEIGKGSTFYFTIPCEGDLQDKEAQAQQTETASSTDKERSNRSLKIVIAEDNFVSDLYLKSILNINGNEILHATTGTEAVEIVRNNPDTDVVLMDISMPELNGYEATSQIRQFNKTAIIIVQSGYAFEENIKKATEAGCTDFISKPVDENELLRLIEKHVRK